VRGNPFLIAHDMTLHGPIPAGAGEPERLAETMCEKRAYPRGCGGTNGADTVKSPLGGPIPAGAGEPVF